MLLTPAQPRDPLRRGRKLEDFYEHRKEIALSSGGKIILQGTFNSLDLCGLDRHTIDLLLAVLEDHEMRLADGSRSPQLMDLVGL